MKVQLLKNIYNPAKVQNNYFGFDYCLLLTKDRLSKDTVEISFGEKRLSSENFKIKKIENLRCSVCGKLMLNDEQTESFVEDVASKKGYQLVQALKKYEDDSIFTKKPTSKKTSVYRPINQAAVDIIKRLAKQNPHEDLYGLFRIQNEKSLRELIPVQIDVMDKFEEYALSHATDDEHKEKLKSLIEEYRKQIYGLSEIQFSRKKFIYDAVHSFSDKDEQEEVNEIVQNLPNSKNNVHAFFVKYTSLNKNSKGVAKSLILQTIATTEHILPKSKGGKDVLSNYIVDCGECNSARQNLDFDEWIQDNPNIQKNLQEYLSEVQKAIDSGFLDKEYKRYIPNVRSTIERLSKGKIKLKLTDSKNPKITAETSVEKKGKLSELAQKIEEATAKKDSLELEIKEAESSEEYKLYSQYEILCKEIDIAKSKIKPAEDELKQLKDSLNRVSYAAVNPFSRPFKKQKNKSACEMNNIKTQINEQRKKLKKIHEDLKKLKAERDAIVGKMPVLEDVEEQIADLSQKRVRKNKVTAEIQKNKSIADGETNVKQKYMHASNEMFMLQKQNEKILEAGFDVSDTSDYEEYKNSIELLVQAERIQKERKYGNNSPETMYKLINIAMEALQTATSDLLQRDSVIYFTNTEKIQKLKTEIGTYSKFLSDVAKAKDQLSKLYKRLTDISKEIGDIDLDSELERLYEQKTALQKIRRIKPMKKEYEELSETIEHNQAIYDKIRNFESLSNEEFFSLVEQIR